MTEPTHRMVTANGIQIHIAEQGRGPLILLCHGFPESWYSWRHQLRDLAQAGFHAVAPDMRGYGATESPSAVDAYTLLHLVGDMVGVLDAVDVEQAVIVGHDWGAPVAWNAALLRPDRFRGVVGLSVPYQPRSAVRPLSVMPQTADTEFYQLYFQTPGVAEAELQRDVRRSLRTIYTSRSSAGALGMVARGGGFLDAMTCPDVLPAWLTEPDLKLFTGEFERTGFAGGLNWYRNIDRNWELMAAFNAAPIRVPALYMGGDHDLVLRLLGRDRVLERLARTAPLLRGATILPDCGHWTQQERPNEVSAAIVDFVNTL